jgi:hypothetical protein
VRHLSTEELLLHCDGTLAPELAVHLDECPGCRDSWFQVQAVLFEAEEVLRGSVPEEPLDQRIASRLNLERALYPPKTSAGFPLRWSMVYSVAAALTITVLGGYLSTRQHAPESSELAAVSQAPAVSSEPRIVPERSAPSPAALDNARQAAANAGPSGPSSDVLVAESIPAPVVPAARQDETESVPGQPEAQPVRFELSAPGDTQIEAKQVAWVAPPKVATTSPSNVPVAALLPTPPVPTFRTVVLGAAPTDSALARVSGPEAFSKVIEGYWLLTEAKVWEEDLQPVWTSRGLVIEGTVEDEAVRQHVEAALLRQTSQPPTFHLSLREDLPTPQPRARRARVVQAVYSGPAGGTVRRSLLGHFSDAARQSFVSPQPTALEAEVVRYVSEVYRSQSDLLSHAYALQRFLDRVDVARLESADPQTTRRFRDLVRFHLRALDDGEAAIYDRLSEALPRKVWSHRGEGDDSGEAPDWSDESQNLLQDTLELDSNLTALFGTSSLTLDAKDPEQSCGELLNRIRTRIQRIKTRTQAL